MIARRHFGKHFAVALFLVTGLAAPLAAADFYQINRHSLADFQFEGVPLGASPEELKRHLPEAQFAYDKIDSQAGVVAYAVADTKTADGACFYFMRNRLYQIDIEYKKPRVEALGGAGAIMDNLMAALGPPDYADFFRRSWYQPPCKRRADFWVNDDAGMLVITDVSRAETADRRLHKANPDAVLDLGFERREQQAAK